MVEPLEITGEELAWLVEKDPDWVATNATEKTPVRITTYCDMTRSPIRALSPHITFAGRDSKGDAATFFDCDELDIAEGVFEGLVSFENSSVSRIGDLQVTQPDRGGRAASFASCRNLEIARGTFNGQVSFENSRIHKIDVENLKVLQPDNDGCAADFFDCESLEIAEGKFPGAVDFGKSGITSIGKLELTAPRNCPRWIANFQECMNLTTARGCYPKPVTFASSAVVRISPNLRVVEKEASEAYEADFSRCGNLTECPLEMMANHKIDPKNIQMIKDHNRRAERARKAMTTGQPSSPEL